ncbi:MAG: bifunctional methylenetetrahydrofolate dehydrogenase/methenyltetrahydrofolate cyclohydrolase FolD [Pelagibacterales bacterium]|nr:bifunctional methylenetetrahydrofolate dehydrogenase/methenyltetrahydrofolate cyclohydrolase FolD [Pelagibacterales bacterium]
MNARILNGKEIAAELRTCVAKAVTYLNKQSVYPGLATILVGRDSASSVYVANKSRLAKELGIKSFQYNLEENITEKELIKLIHELNDNHEVDGILVQLPLPKHINTDIILDTIKPNKDVDGFHTINAGNLYLNRKAVIPCTPLGCLIMLRSLKVSLHGLRAVIIGRSNIVGKPMSQLLLKENCTVTVVHSYTKNIKEIVKESDIVVAALGIANYVKESWIKPGAIVIDVGINRIKENGKNKLVGDVEFDKIKNIASAITPVPGGVGPMTIACLLMNTVLQCSSNNNIELDNNNFKKFIK